MPTKSIRVKSGKWVHFIVEAQGYQRIDNREYVTTNINRTMAMTPEVQQVTLTISPQVASSRVWMGLTSTNLTERSSITVTAGTRVYYRIIATGYDPVVDDMEVNVTETISPTQRIARSTLYLYFQDSSYQSINVDTVVFKVNNVVVSTQTNVSSASYTADYGTTVTYEATKAGGYVIQSGSWTYTENDHSIILPVIIPPQQCVVNFDAQEAYTFTPIHNVTWVINGVTSVGDTATVTVNYDDDVTVEATASGYRPYSGTTGPVRSNPFPFTAIMQPSQSATVTFNVTPSDATIKVNGNVISGNTYTGNIGDTITYQFIRENYATEPPVSYEITTVAATIFKSMHQLPRAIINIYDENDNPVVGTITIDGTAHTDVSSYTYYDPMPGNVVHCKVEASGYKYGTDPYWEDDITLGSFDSTVTENIQLTEIPDTSTYLTMELRDSDDELYFFTSHSDFSRSIRYSIDDGNTWTPITSSTTGTKLDNVSAGDIIRISYDPNSAQNTGYGNQSYRTYFANKNNGTSGSNGVYVYNKMSSLIAGGGSNAAWYCFKGIFDGLDVRNKPGKPIILSDVNVTLNCFEGMFQNCSSLVTAPELPATTLATSCYKDMFKNCSNLNSITCLATNISATNCTTSWVDGVSSTGTFVKNPNMTSWTTGASGIPTNWTIRNVS